MKTHEYSELTWALLPSFHWWLELDTYHVEQASASASFLIPFTPHHQKIYIQPLFSRFGPRLPSSNKVIPSDFQNN